MPRASMPFFHPKNLSRKKQNPVNQTPPSHTSSPMSAPEPTIPPALQEALRRVERAQPTPDLEVLDRYVLAAADTHFARRTRNHSRLRTLRIAAGIAASIALIAAVAWRLAPVGPTGGTLAADALDTSHSITILDAFHLARLLQAREATHAPLSPTWDVTRDGVVDSGDVAALAQRAVKVSFSSTAQPDRLGPTAPGGGT